MSSEQDNTELTIRYPQRQGCILEAFKLKQHLVVRFDLAVEFEEQLVDYFTVILHGVVIYSKPVEKACLIDHQEIITEVGRYTKTIAFPHEAPPEPDDTDDPDHISWMNSVCSGE